VVHTLRIRILRILKILKIHDFFQNFKMPTNFKNKIRSTVIIHEIYPASIYKYSVKFLADIYIIRSIYSVKLKNIVSIL